MRRIVLGNTINRLACRPHLRWFPTGAMVGDFGSFIVFPVIVLPQRVLLSVGSGMEQT